MASILKVDEMQGVTSAGDITITGEGTATMQLQQGLAKVWINFDGQSTIATRDSHNSSSISDDGTGQYTTSYTSNMASVSYAASGGHNRSGLSSTTFNNDSTWAASTSSVGHTTADSTNTGRDCDAVMVSILGDLA